MCAGSAIRITIEQYISRYWPVIPNGFDKKKITILNKGDHALPPGNKMQNPMMIKNNIGKLIPFILM